MLFSWLNPTRLRVYPRLIAGTMGVILLLNAVLGQGWMGATGQVIGSDFISLYSSGIILQREPSALYDFEVQAKVQEALLAPTRTWGVNPFTNPPYVAEVMHWLARMPMASALIFWLILSLAAIALASWLIAKHLLPAHMAKTSLTSGQVFIVTVSSMAFLEGFHMGQNHAITLLLFTGTLVLTMRRQWLAAGLVGGFLLYKPHFALGFLIIWFVWQRWQALLGFGCVAVIWVGSFLLTYGWQLISEYLGMGTFLLKAEYLPERSGNLGVTPYNLLVDILPEPAWPGIVVFTLVLLLAAAFILAFYAFKQRGIPENERYATFILVVLFPLLVSPHVLLHDLVILVPALALWAHLWQDRKFLNLVIAIYAGTFVLPLAAKLLGISVLAVIPTGLAAILLYQLAHNPVSKQTELIV